jgi:hypothetical protein
MQRVLAAWATHTDFPNLPAVLSPRLRRTGLETIRQAGMSLVNRSYHHSSFAFWGARLIHAYVKQRELIPADEADEWLAEFDNLEREGAFFLSSTPILTQAIKLG